MNNENTKQLLDAFPELYRGREKPVTENLMRFGFGCKDGWFNIVWQLSEQITNAAHKANVDVPEVLQVKEKFGGFRFYLGSVNEAIAGEVNALVEHAGDMAAKTCEDCGEPGMIRNDGGWFHTSCDQHTLNK